MMRRLQWPDIFSSGHDICFFEVSGHRSTEVFEMPRGKVDVEFEQLYSLRMQRIGVHV